MEGMESCGQSACHSAMTNTGHLAHECHSSSHGSRENVLHFPKHILKIGVCEHARMYHARR